MNVTRGITGEHFDHKLAAIFEEENKARTAADALRQNTSLQGAQVLVVAPSDPDSGWELEPEDKGIWRTLIWSHLWLGLAGAIAGVIFFGILYIARVMFILANPIAAVLITAAFGAVFGMLLAGLITLRPDHMPYVSVAQSALKRGKFVVTVHARSLEQLNEAKAMLNNYPARTISTF